jgi:hypothetical protein
MDQAKRLEELLCILPLENRLWTAEERREARALIALLCEHGWAAERPRRAA